MRRIHTIALCGLLALGAALPLPAQQEQAKPAETTEERPARSEQPKTEGVFGIFVLKHLNTRDAVSLLRSTLQVRQLAELRGSGTIVIRAEPRDVKAATELLERVDVAPPRWTAELVLVGKSGEVPLRQLNVAGEKLRVRFGPGDGGHVGVSIEADQPRTARLRAQYRIDMLLPGADGIPPFVLDESGEMTFGDGERLTVARPAISALRRALAGVLGLEGEAQELFLRFRRTG